MTSKEKGTDFEQEYLKRRKQDCDIGMTVIIITFIFWFTFIGVWL